MLKKAGLWKSFTLEVETLRQTSSLNEFEATNVCLGEFLKRCPDYEQQEFADVDEIEEYEAERIRSKNLSILEKSGIPKAPAEIVNRTASEIENIRWVYNHIATDDLSDCPSPGAWLEVHMCQTNPGYLQTFLTSSRAKIIPNRAQLLEDDEHEFDGKPTLVVLDKIMAIKKDSETKNEVSTG